MSGMILKVWKSANVQDKVNSKPKQQALSNEICGKILDLQLQTENSTLQKQTVVQLLDLYSQAVEFYEERENPKYKNYQRRMQSFLKRPDIQFIMKGQDEQFQTFKKKQIYNAQIQKATQGNKIMVQKIIAGTEFKAKKQKSIIQQALQYQDNQFQQRLVRRRSNSNRSITSKQDKAIKQKMNINININILLQGIQTRQRKKVFF